MRKTVARFADGDVANELLRGFRIDSSVLCRSVMAAPWGFGVVDRDAGSYHMVLEGQGWLEVEGVTEPVHVRAGDLVVLPTGSAHWIRDSRPRPRPRSARSSRATRSSTASSASATTMAR
jgi:hypothetical protein